MKKQLLAAALACAAPLSQAQTWTRLVGDAPGQSTTLATTQALATGQDGIVHVQTTSVTAVGQTIGHLYAFGGDGDPLSWLTTTAVRPGGGSLLARGVSALDGHRVSWYDTSAVSVGAVSRSLVLYKPGQSAPDLNLGIGSSGTALEFFASDGVDGVFAVYDDPNSGDKPRLASFAHPNFIRWSRMVGGCPSNDFLPVKVLAADYESGPVPRISVVTRCEATPAQGGGQISVVGFDPLNGNVLSRRNSWPYPDSDAPVVAAQAIGEGRIVIEQADSQNGDRIVRVADFNGAEDPLPMPSNFRPGAVVRFQGGALIPAVDVERKNVGALRFDSHRINWVDYAELQSVARQDLVWGANASGMAAVAYREPAEVDAGRPVQLRVLSDNGRVVSRRRIDVYPTQAQGRIELLALARDDAALVLAADVELPDGRGSVYLEQFPLQSDSGELPIGVVVRPR